MLQRLQSNVQQTKQQAMSVQQAMPQAVLSQPMHHPSQLQAPVQADPRGASAANTEYDSSLEQRILSASTPAEIEEVGKAVLSKLPTLPPEHAAEVLSKMERMIGMYHGEFLAEISRLLAARMKECTSTQIAQLMSAFLVWKPDSRERFSEFSKELSATAFQELSSRLMEIVPHELNCCLAGFLALGHSDSRFLTAVGRSVLARSKTFGAPALAALLTILSEMRLVHADLFAAAAQVLCSKVRELRPADILRVLRAFSKCNIPHETLCHAISNDILTRFKEKGPSGAGFSAEQLCEVAWMLCVLQSYNEELLKLVLKQLELAPRISTDSLCMIYEVHLALDCEFKEAYSRFRISADKVMALQQLYAQSRKDARRCSERLRSDVATVLKSLVEGTVSANHRTSIGLLADVAALRKRSSTDGYIHIDIDSPLTSVRPVDQEETANAPVLLDGSVAFRRRIMQKHNLRLIAVHEHQWRRLDDSKEKRRHLRSLLATLGDVTE